MAERKTVKRKLKDGTEKCYQLKGVRKQVELNFLNEDDRDDFNVKFELAKRKSGLSTNADIMSFVLDQYLKSEGACEESRLARATEKCVESSSIDHDVMPQPLCRAAPAAETESSACRTKTSQYDPQLFVAERQQITSLADLLHRHASFCSLQPRVVSSSMNTHVYVVHFACGFGHEFSWTSSTERGDDFLVNNRLYLGHIASGILPVQYKKFTQFSRLGSISNKLLRLGWFCPPVTHLSRHSLTTAQIDDTAKGFALLSDSSDEDDNIDVIN